MKKKATCYYCKEIIFGPMIHRIQVKVNDEVVGIAHPDCFMDNTPNKEEQYGK